MIYITRTRFLNVMIDPYNDFFYVGLEVCFVIILDDHLHLCESEQAVSANLEV